MIFLESKTNVKVTVTQRQHVTLPDPKMYPYTKFGIPISNNIGVMLWSRIRQGCTDTQTDSSADFLTNTNDHKSDKQFGSKSGVAFVGPDVGQTVC